MLDHISEIKPSMPPFPGTQTEKLALADYLATLGPAGASAAPDPGNLKSGINDLKLPPVPGPDMLGLPAPAWLAQGLQALTLSLHWVFLAITAGCVGGLLLGRKDPDLRRRLAEMAALSLAVAMTLGIAPLLFVQVLYGQFFYSANILMGYVWLGLLAIMIAAFYLLHYCRRQAVLDRHLRLPALVALGLMGMAAVILVANATLTQTPQAWRAFSANGGTKPYLADPAFWPRWSMAAAALLAGGGLFLAIWRRAKSQGSVRSATAAAIVGMLAMLGVAAWIAKSLPAGVAEKLSAGPESIFAYAVMVAVAAAIVLAVLSLRTRSLAVLSLSGLALFVGLLATAAARDTIRRAALSPGFDVAAVAVHPQWDTFVVWAGVFVAGLGLCAYMIALTVRSERRLAAEAAA